MYLRGHLKPDTLPDPQRFDLLGVDATRSRDVLCATRTPPRKDDLSGFIRVPVLYSVAAGFDFDDDLIGLAEMQPTAYLDVGAAEYAFVTANQRAVQPDL